MSKEYQIIEFIHCNVFYNPTKVSVLRVLSYTVYLRKLLAIHQLDFVHHNISDGEHVVYLLLTTYDCSKNLCKCRVKILHVNIKTDQQEVSTL